MREYQIRIEPFDFIALQRLRIEQKINQHAKAQVVMCIKDDRQEHYMGILSNETWVKIIGVGEEADNEVATHIVLFYGLVMDFQFDHDGYKTTLMLEMMSGSYLMDLKQHFRVFQHDTTRCIDVHNKLTATYPEGKAVCREGNEDKVDGVLIQHQETDWEFLKRIAGKDGRYLVPDIFRKGVRYTIGLPMGINRTVQLDRVNIKLNINEYMQKTYNGMSSLQAADMLELVLTEREIFQIGDNIFYQDKEYFIYQIQTDYERGECNHTYYFRTRDAMKTLPLNHEGIAGCSFDAIVTNVQKDTVQIEIEHDEWNAVDGKKWFLYSTVYSSADGTGWYCMPELGDSVRLYVPEKEEDSFVISAVHKQTEKARQNPDYKSLKTKYGKEILFTPDTILFTNNQGMSVELNDSKGIAIFSDKGIVIEAGDNLTISSANASLVLTAKDILQVRQGGTSMTLDDDIYFTGGEFRIQ